MPTDLTERAFGRLLDQFDPDRDRAAERYEELRRTLLRFFEWRGAPFPEEHTDETFDRVARKLADGVAIATIGGYTFGVARLVLLEALKERDARRARLEANRPIATTDAPSAAAEKERRFACLDECLSALPADSREVIVAYYRDDQRERIEGRRRLAGRLGLRPEALANRAQRLRDKLQRCVTACIGRKST